jgi:Arc/MetJ-type ribon-helix-helix transcriptional regulator
VAAWLPLPGVVTEPLKTTAIAFGAVERYAYPASPPASGMTEYTTVSIPKELGDRVEETIEGTSFSSTSDLVRFLLRSIVIQHQRRGELTEAEFEEIADQLADLGYLD